MDTRGQRQDVINGMESGTAIAPPGKGKWQQRGDCGGMDGTMRDARAIPDNRRIRELLGWGLIQACEPD
jgi:hypothetical protein